jgi:ribosomal protein S18 acetylase RimI-like enzyme
MRNVSDTAGGLSLSGPTIERHIVQHGAESVRVEISHPSGTAGRNEPRALLFPLNEAPLSPALVGKSLTHLRSIAFSGWVESIALADSELAGFQQNDFRTRQSLCLLIHDLDGYQWWRRNSRLAIDLETSGLTCDVISVTGQGISRQLPVDELLETDRRAFVGDTPLDPLSLQHSLSATPQVNVTLVWDRAEPFRKLLGFAISGQSGRGAYLQRLAVDPFAQGAGIGRFLCEDALRWAKRRGAKRMVVNTQHTNQRALKLYDRVGFLRASTGLTVVGRLLCQTDQDQTDQAHQ